jgi:hypothetical protein
MPTWLHIILANAAVTVVFIFAAYIWRSMEGRIREIEKEEKSYTDKLIERPVLTIQSHAALCTKNTGDVKAFVEAQTNQLSLKMDEGEKRTGLLIENAILKANGNGRKKSSGKGKK